jgi:hypothetical protein
VRQNQIFLFDTIDVEPFSSEPSLLVIIGKDDNPENAIVLDRSFADALRENIDRETIYRQCALSSGQ